MQPDAPDITTFAQLAAEGADASRVADAAVAQWREVEMALSPIIGPSAVAALFKRSLQLTRANHPCLHALSESTLLPGDYAGLHAALARETGFDAAIASDVLRQTFRDLLAHLIGTSLAERLLRAARDDSRMCEVRAARPPIRNGEANGTRNE
jgi:hypothetical protein